jgi:hypothetical protein
MLIPIAIRNGCIVLFKNPQHYQYLRYLEAKYNRFLEELHLKKFAIMRTNSGAYSQFKRDAVKNNFKVVHFGK